MTRRQPFAAYLINNNDFWDHSNDCIEIMNYLVTGLICSGKSTFLKIAEEYNFHVIRSDDIVCELYNDSSINEQIKKYLDIKLFNAKPKETVKEFSLQIEKK